MIQPTIGRVVLVYRGESDQAEPGLVSYVYNNKRINVGGFDRYGEPFSAESIQLLQDDDTPEDPLWYAEWMPYQKAQAKKDKS
jgi:hypothetical protein